MFAVDLCGGGRLWRKQSLHFRATHMAAQTDTAIVPERGQRHNRCAGQGSKEAETAHPEPDTRTYGTVGLGWGLCPLSPSKPGVCFWLGMTRSKPTHTHHPVPGNFATSKTSPTT